LKLIKDKRIDPRLRSDVDDVHRGLAEAGDAARSTQKSALAAGCLNSVLFSVSSLRHDIHCMKYELEKVKCHFDCLVQLGDQVLLATRDISHVDPSFCNPDSSIPAIDIDIFVTFHSDLDNGHWIADEVGLTTEPLSGPVTDRHSHLVEFSMAYNHNYGLWTMKVNY
jgi:hypothetical protein